MSQLRGTPLITGPGITEQAHKDDCDINYILRDYQKAGMLKHATKHAGKYDDVRSSDFQAAMLTVSRAKNMFEELPANWRKRFKNDVGAFLDFVQNPSNRDEMAKMGMLKGNDGLTAKGAPSGAPKETPAPNPPATPPA